MYEEEVRREALAFEQQFHYGVFYAYMRLREQVLWATSVEPRADREHGPKVIVLCPESLIPWCRPVDCMVASI